MEWSFLDISLVDSDGVINFKTVNNKGSVESIEKEAGKGIGIENVNDLIDDLTQALAK